MTQVQKIETKAMADGAKPFSMMIRVADPTVDSHPFVLYAPVALRILNAYTQTRSGTGTDTVTSTVMVEGVDLVDYTDMLSTATNGIETSAGTDVVANDVAAGEVIEIDITALTGTGHNYFDVQITGRLL